MDDSGGTVRAFLARHGLSQAALAREAGVSQSSVSRAMTGRAFRRGRARSRLFVYMQQAEAAAQPALTLTAVSETWDGSEAHAEALAKLILASRELWPNMRKE